MPRRLVVIIGAGASHDCASELVHKVPEKQPPLVKDLFTPGFGDILSRYPLAQAAATDIRRAVAPETENAVPLEQYLREQLRDAGDSYAQRRFRQIPLYLQELFLTVGKTDGGGFTTEPDNYNALINRALALDDVLFLSLNYDTLFDDRLFIYGGGLRDLNSYVVSDPKWALVKLHGSVNWGQRIVTNLSLPSKLVDQRSESGLPVNMFEIVNAVISDPAELKWATNDIELRLQPELADRRFDGRDGAVYYPALSIPVGEEDELFCPPEHLAAARERLKSGDGLNLLVLGYSGLDQEVLRLLRESEAKVRSLFVVNGNERASLEAADRIMRAISGGTGVRADSVFAGGFTDAVKTGALGDFINSVSLN